MRNGIKREGKRMNIYDRIKTMSDEMAGDLAAQDVTFT